MIVADDDIKLAVAVNVCQSDRTCDIGIGRYIASDKRNCAGFNKLVQVEPIHLWGGCPASRAAVADDQIEVTVSVEVTDRDRQRAIRIAGSEFNAGINTARAIAQVKDIGQVPPCLHKVDAPITIQIGTDDDCGRPVGQQNRRLGESTVPIAEVIAATLCCIGAV